MLHIHHVIAPKAAAMQLPFGHFRWTGSEGSVIIAALIIIAFIAAVRAAVRTIS